jgi:hypothetical protein
VERAKILVLANGGGLERAERSNGRKLTPARVAVFMVERAKRDMLSF